MKRTQGCIVIIGMIAYMVTGCNSHMLATNEVYYEMETISEFREVDAIAIVEEAVLEEQGTSAEGITYEELVKYGGYAYMKLSMLEREIYEDIYEAILNRHEKVELYTMDEDMMSKVYYCVLQDHPELFYVEGFSGKKYLQNNTIIRMELMPEYSLSEADTAMYEQNLADYVALFRDQLPVEVSEYDVVKSIYEYIVLHTDYNTNAPLNQTICSVTTYGESVCQGYAETFQYLCGEMGILATVVTGFVKDGGNHAWNLVRVDGEYYYVDVTWGDPEYGNDAAYKVEGSVNYDYLLLNDEQIGKTHVIDSLIPMPVCTATEANYYRQEGLYLTAYDSHKIQSIFAQAQERGEHVVSIQGATREVYEEMNRYLLEENGVFAFLSEACNSIPYTHHEEYLVLTFWID